MFRVQGFKSLGSEALRVESLGFSLCTAALLKTAATFLGKPSSS